MNKSILKKIAVCGMASAMVFQMAACKKNEEKETTGSETVASSEVSKEESSEVSSEASSETLKEGAVLSLDQLPILDGATANEPYYEGVVAKMCAVDNDTAKANILCTTTGEAFKNLINGTVDMIFVSYPSDAQVQAATEAGVEFEYHHILTGGFVFFVNVDNPIDSLTVDQLKGIYKGEITNWKEVGGKDEPIVAFQREEGSGSQNGLYRYVLPKDEVMKAPEKYYFDDMCSIVDAFGNAEYDNADNAIGYSYYYYVTNMECNDKIKLVKIEGIEPNNETIGQGTYPFCNPTLAVVRKGTDPNSKVYDIIDWIMSDEGAKLAEELGYVANRSEAADEVDG